MNSDERIKDRDAGKASLLGRREERRTREAWTCSSCGATVVRGNDWVPRFCSNCGREIGRWGS